MSFYSVLIIDIYTRKNYFYKYYMFYEYEYLQFKNCKIIKNYKCIFNDNNKTVIYIYFYNQIYNIDFVSVDVLVDWCYCLILSYGKLEYYIKGTNKIENIPKILFF